MKVTLRTVTPPIEAFGSLDVAEVYSQTEVYIDDRRCPPTLERIILLGLNTATEQYMSEVEAMMKLERGE